MATNRSKIKQQVKGKLGSGKRFKELVKKTGSKALAAYKNSIDALRNQARRTRRDDMQSPASPEGGPTPVIQGAN